jgi:hypothetical protein
MLGRKVKIIASREPWDGITSFRMAQFSDEQGMWVAQELMFKEQQKGNAVRPFMELYDEDTQALMDELWRAGFRPREGSGSAGSLAATEKHLEDMRRLVFDKS